MTLWKEEYVQFPTIIVRLQWDKTPIWAITHVLNNFSQNAVSIYNAEMYGYAVDQFRSRDVTVRRPQI